MKATWQLQEAKNRFSEVVNLAMTQGEQTITRHGKPVVVVRRVNPADKRGRSGKRKSLVQLLRECPDGDFLAKAIADGRERMRKADKPRKLEL